MMQAGSLVGPYRLVRMAGSGAMADVWQAEDSRSGQAAAVKILRPAATAREEAEQERRFLAEAHTVRMLQHPDIVEVLGDGIDDDGRAWIALEWLDAQPLTRHINPSLRLSDGAAVAIGERVARALGHAHRKAVVHRDIKPDNILVDPSASVVKVADFGVARVEDASATQTGVVLGTPAYMAPEQLAGAPANPHADLYSLGVVLFELLSLHRPIEAPNLGQWLRRISQEPATPLCELRPDLPPALGQIVDRLLERNPAKRPQRGEDVANALERCMQG